MDKFKKQVQIHFDLTDEEMGMFNLRDSLLLFFYISLPFISLWAVLALL